jgi:hypothetical protein
MLISLNLEVRVSTPANYCYNAHDAKKTEHEECGLLGYCSLGAVYQYIATLNI